MHWCRNNARDGALHRGRNHTRDIALHLSRHAVSAGLHHHLLRVLLLRVLLLRQLLHLLLITRHHLLVLQRVHACLQHILLHIRRLHLQRWITNQRRQRWQRTFTLQPLRNVLHGLKAPVAVFFHRAQTDRFQLGRDRDAAATAGRLWHLEHVLGQRAHERFCLEWHTPRQHLVQDAAERIDVDAVIRNLAARLLWRHVLGGTKDHACSSQAPWAFLDGAHLGDAEVQDFYKVGAALTLD